MGEIHSIVSHSHADPVRSRRSGHAPILGSTRPRLHTFFFPTSTVLSDVVFRCLVCKGHFRTLASKTIYPGVYATLHSCGFDSEPFSGGAEATSNPQLGESNPFGRTQKRGRQPARKLIVQAVYPLFFLLLWSIRWRRHRVRRSGYVWRRADPV